MDLARFAAPFFDVVIWIFCVICAPLGLCGFFAVNYWIKILPSETELCPHGTDKFGHISACRLLPLAVPVAKYGGHKLVYLHYLDK